MGLKGMAEGMGSQAANIWKMLDDLAVTDKKAYVELTKSGRDEMVSVVNSAHNRRFSSTVDTQLSDLPLTPDRIWQIWFPFSRAKTVSV